MAGVLTKCARFVARSGLVQQEATVPLASGVHHTRQCMYECWVPECCFILNYRCHVLTRIGVTGKSRFTCDIVQSLWG